MIGPGQYRPAQLKRVKVRNFIILIENAAKLLGNSNQFMFFAFLIIGLQDGLDWLIETIR